MAVGDRIKVALETDVAAVQAEVDAGALEIVAINDEIETIKTDVAGDQELLAGGNVYVDTTSMIADQGNQTLGQLYQADVAFYKYKGVPTVSIDDYDLVGGSDASLTARVVTLEGEVDDIEEELNGIGSILSSTGSTTQSSGESYNYRSMSLTAGTWLIHGNAFLDTSSAATAGYIKASLAESTNTFSKYNTMQVDRGAEADTGLALSPIVMDVASTDTVYINGALEVTTVTGTWYFKIIAQRIK